MTLPYSIFNWQPARTSSGRGTWIEPVQVYTQEYALYVANLIYKDSKAVVKVMRYGLTIASFPNEQTVERIEQFIARQQSENWP